MQVNATPGNWLLWPQMGLAPSGQIVVSWFDAQRDTVFVQRLNADGSRGWSADTATSSHGSQNDYDMAVDRSGNSIVTPSVATSRPMTYPTGRMSNMAAALACAIAAVKHSPRLPLGRNAASASLLLSCNILGGNPGPARDGGQTAPLTTPGAASGRGSCWKRDAAQAPRRQRSAPR